MNVLFFMLFGVLTHAIEDDQLKYLKLISAVCYEKNYQKLEQQFAEVENWQDIVDCYGNTLLHKAATTGNINGLWQILAADVPADKPNKGGITPLGKAARSGDTVGTHILLTYGCANVNGLGEGHFTPLHLAAEYDSVDTEKLLLDWGANHSLSAPMGVTPLHWAFLHNSPNVFVELVKAGADIYACDRRGRTPFNMVYIELKKPWVHEKGNETYKSSLMSMWAAIEVQ